MQVSSILPYNEKAVYIEGDVFRPGKYPYRDGITVNELLRSHQDLLPEPADHAYIISARVLPHFRPMTISFQLSDVLVGDNRIHTAALRCDPHLESAMRSIRPRSRSRARRPARRTSSVRRDDRSRPREHGGRVQAKRLS